MIETLTDLGQEVAGHVRAVDARMARREVSDNGGVITDAEFDALGSAMTESDERRTVDYFSDVLCVWAWISQPRLEEAVSEWSDEVAIRLRFIDVFGDAHRKILGGWGEDRGFERFAEHLGEATEGHDHARIHPDLWRGVRPTSSLPAHLHLKAVELSACAGKAAAYARAMREAFFVDGRDISRHTELERVARTLDLDVSALHAALGDGSAQAALARDQHAAQENRIAGSPTWLMNDGRQVLYGNVGYRIIEANLEELLRDDPGGASWC